jgi:hypothetical protein
MFGTDVRATRFTWMCPDSVICTPASSRPMPAVFGTDPTAMRQWLPSTVRPSDRVTSTPSPSRSTFSARDFDSTFIPPRLNTFSRTAAASRSSPGSTCSRLETRVTFAPRFMYAEANSAPVTPDPTTMRCSGSVVMSYSCVHVRMR